MQLATSNSSNHQTPEQTTLYSSTKTLASDLWGVTAQPLVNAGSAATWVGLSTVPSV